MEKQYLEQLVSQGLSQYSIAEETNKSRTTVQKWLKRHGLKTLPADIRNEPRRCRSCGEDDPEKFYRRDKTGRLTKSICKECQHKDINDFFREQKKLAVSYKGGSCQKCGYNSCLAALDFHHRNPVEKDPKWVRMRKWRFDRMKPELDKCDLLCNRCHVETHETMRGRS